jgi:predicted AlkP superfamily phosphohydrolase/phosphomutase
VNLAGRERRGVVALEQYESVLDETEDLVRSCRDPATGESVVRSVERTAASRGVDPSELGSSEADLVVEWNGAFGFEHPAIGLIGPLPFKRTGGHTGPLGSVVIAGATTPERDLGVVSAFDIVPTIFALLGEEVPEGLSGEPLAASFTG